MKMKPAAYDMEVLYAFRALFAGVANEGQQKHAMEWLLLNCCHIGSTSFEESDRETAFREGERHIGLQIARLREPAALALIEGKARTKSEATEANK